MPVVVGGVKAEHVASNGTHRLHKVTEDHYVVIGDDVPDGRWLDDQLPSGSWFTEWAGDADGLLVVHVMRQPAHTHAA
jgi:hypothetical protein